MHFLRHLRQGMPDWCAGTHYYTGTGIKVRRIDKYGNERNETFIGMVVRAGYDPTRRIRKRNLYVGLGNKDGNYKFEKRPVSEDMIEKFTGGRGSVLSSSGMQ